MKKPLLLLLIMCLLQLPMGICYSQTKNTNGISITGKVVDNLGDPLTGVSIMIEKTTKGTISDINGEFSIAVPDSKAVLAFSYLGYVKRSVKVNNDTKINVVLEENSQDLEELVVVGYGTQRKADLTGSVASVTSKQLKDIPVSSAAQAIVGKMPGVYITHSDGSPDADVKIRIRGGGSLTQDSSPLYIVDGYEVDNISDIPPSDIASVDVLKDASSTAIYGARGAYGVIIITTKRGTEGTATVSYNMYFGIKNVTKKLDVLNPYEYVYSQYELQSGSASFSRYFGEIQDLDLYKRMKGTDWQEELFGRTGTSLSNSLSVSGGTKMARYNVSLMRNDEKEIMLGSDQTKTNLSVRTDFQLKPWLKVDLTTRYLDQEINGAGLEGGSNVSYNRLPHVVQFRPINGLSDFVDSSLVGEDDFDILSEFSLNPLEMTLDDYRKYNRTLLNVNVGADFTITKRLKYRFTYGIQSDKSTDDRFWGVNTSNAWSYGKQPLAEIRHLETNSWRISNVLTYDYKNFLPKHNLRVMLGEELNHRESGRTISSAKYFPKHIGRETALAMMNMGTADPIATYIYPNRRTSSFFGRLNYDYKGRYLFSSSMRADGSSKFARGNRWGYFPSAAGAWRVSDEAFMQPTEDWLSNLKLRLSYGQAGNDRIADNLETKLYTSVTGKLYMDEVPTNYLEPGTILSNPRLKWETTTSQNIGLDFGFFNQRLSGAIEVYNNVTSDLLIKASIPKNTGYTHQYQNIGQTSNKGIELTLTGAIIDKKDFKLSASVNVSFNKNRIDKLGETKEWEETSAWAPSDGPTGDYLVREGGEIGLIYGYVTDGMYTFDDFTYANGVYTLNPDVANNSKLIGAKWFAPGALKFVNQDDNLEVNAKDKVVIGNTNPKHMGGFTLTSEFKGFDLTAAFNWVYGNDVYNANKLSFTSNQSGRLYKNLLDVMNSEDRFTYVSTETGQVVMDPVELAAMNQNATIWSHAHTTTQLHSWAVEDGSFLRLNNLTIGYTFPKSVISKMKLTQLRLYVTGYNLYTWTKYSGYDPEVDGRRSTPLTPGVDWSAYPRSRTFNMGVNVTF